MIRFIKKWWLLRKLYRDTLGHDILQPDDFLLQGSRNAVARDEFVKWIAKESVHRYRWILWRRFWNNSEKLRRRIREYNSILESLDSDGRIQKLKAKGDSRVFIQTTPQGDDSLGLISLLQELLAKYYLAWTGIIFPLLVGIFGHAILKESLEKVWEYLNL